MPRKPSASLFAPLLALTACEHQATASHPEPAAARTTGDPASASRPVLVELYTSQGCSSCPPADVLLAELASDPRGPAVVPLVFHVDYWDALGWPDPFSDARWTRRQRDHAAAIGSGVIYTPQLLFDGRDHRVGTQRARARAAIRSQAATPPAMDFALAVERIDDALQVSPHPRWRDGAERAPLTIMVALTDSGHRTDVRAGENMGLTLDGDHVVRDMASACVMGESDGDGEQEGCRVTLSLAALDHPQSLRIVAFAQDADWRIRGVATWAP